MLEKANKLQILSVSMSVMKIFYRFEIGLLNYYSSYSGLV